jgi:hypothetical protein
LTSVTLGNSVTTIGSIAFADCSSLTSIVIPTSVNAIDSTAFTGSALSTVYIANGQLGIASPTNNPPGVFFFGVTVATFNSVIFSGTGILDQTTVSNYFLTGTAQTVFIEGYSSIGVSAFIFNTQITSVTFIGNTVTNIGGSAFYDCASLTSIVIPNSVITIDYEAFIGCSSLTSVTLGNSVTTIGFIAFANTTSLTSIAIPASVNAIDSIAFTGSALSIVYIANGQTISTIPFISPATGVSFFGRTVTTQLPL